jgi:molecular chaperone DnaK (HSP70)
MREIVHSDRPANIIGIDLGTAEVRVARFNEQGKPEITNNAEGSDVTPAVIQIDEEGSVTIGSKAKAFLGTGAENVFAEFKRAIGTDKSWTVGAKKVTPVDLTALLLKKVVADYSDQFGQPLTIVITWPGNFGKAQREATRDAVARAGLKAVQFIEEPTAAALYYATDTALDGKYLVYDFGGGTFDVTLIEAHGNTITVLYQDGVQQLGGKDLNDALYKIICAKFRAKTGDVFDTFDCNFDRLAIESCKQTLSTRPTVQIRLVSGKYGPIVIVVSRVEFESAIAHLIAQVEMACENVLKCGSPDPFKQVMKHEIREVFMAGEIARIPAMQATIERLFSRKPKVKNPDQAVAMGAAIYGALKQSDGTLNCLQSRSITEVDITDISPHFYGLIYTNWLTGEAHNVTVIRKGERLPFKRTYKVNADRRGYLPTICLTQSAIEEENADFVTNIWEGELHRCAPNAEIDLVFSYNEYGVMCFSVTEVATGKCTKVNLSPGK